jgi:hypothetical protein
MPTFRCTWFFTSDKYQVGWTENWWTTATDAPTASGLVSNYKVVRAALLSDAAKIITVRIASVDHPRDSFFAPTGYPVAGGIAEATYPLAGVWDALLCRRDLAFYNLLGHIFLHFVPAGIFVGRVYTPGSGTPSSWPSAFTAFGNEITVGGPYLLRKSTGGVITYPQCTYFNGQRRTERRLGRPFDALHGRRLVA